jgi:hypothetical protein
MGLKSSMTHIISMIHIACHFTCSLKNTPAVSTAIARPACFLGHAARVAPMVKWCDTQGRTLVDTFPADGRNYLAVSGFAARPAIEL